MSIFKLTLALLLAVVLAGPVFAGAKVSMFGAPNSTGTGPMEVDDARAITVASDATLTVAGTASFTGSTSVASLTATGTIVDAALYSKASGAYPTRLMKVGTDGTLYGGGGTVLIDPALYGSSAGTGAAKILRISADGTIYASN